MIARSRGVQRLTLGLLLSLIGAIAGWAGPYGPATPGDVRSTPPPDAVVRETFVWREIMGRTFLASPGLRRPPRVPAASRPAHILSLALPRLPWMFYVEATAYCDHGTTASGGWVHEGVLAVSQDLRDDLPFGTLVRIEGRAYTVEDAMPSQWHRRVDIWTPSRSRALRWGVRRVVVEALR